jgi:Zn-dependent protease
MRSNIPLSDDLRVAMDYAAHEAARRHAPYIDVEHLMLGLLRNETGPAARLLARQGADLDALYDRVAGAVGRERAEAPIEVKDYTTWAKATLERTAQQATALGHGTLEGRHLLLGLLGESEGVVPEALAEASISAEAVRADLQADAPGTGKAAPPSQAAPVRPAGDAAQGEPEIVVLPFQKPRARRQPRPAAGAQGDQEERSNIPWLAILLVALVIYLALSLPGSTVFTFAFVLIGWIFSVSAHEFAHALVAYLGGDWTVRDKGYLSFNPLRYTHPVTSILLPLVFLALGGIGLPGGAVYIERHRLRNKYWGAAVSAAGPVANLLLAFVLSAPFIFGVVETDIIRLKIFDYYPQDAGGLWENSSLWSAVAFLAMLQVTAVVFNLLPLPPLDGFGIIEPFLDERTAMQLRQLGMYGLLLIFIILWTPLGSEFWEFVFDVVNLFQIPDTLIREGFRDFLFWQNPPT